MVHRPILQLSMWPSPPALWTQLRRTGTMGAVPWQVSVTVKSNTSAPL